MLRDIPRNSYLRFGRLAFPKAELILWSSGEGDESLVVSNPWFVSWSFLRIPSDIPGRILSDLTRVTGPPLSFPLCPRKGSPLGPWVP